jgi:predicted PurR-regulated permease PerM
MPIVALAAVLDPTKGVVLAALFVGWQAFEYVVLQRRVERSTVRVGPFLTALAGFGGVELYGIAGGLLAIFGAGIAVVILDEVASPADRVPHAHGDQ